MKALFLRYTFISGMMFSALVVSNHAMAEEEVADPNYLDVRTSLIPVFGWGAPIGNNYFSPEYFPMNRINPAAKEHIHYCLNFENAKKGQSGEFLHVQVGGIWLLGFIGDQGDIQFVDTFIQTYLNSDKQTRQRFVKKPHLFGSAVGSFAGMMIKRGVPGAEAFFNKYANLASWTSLEDKQTPANLKDVKRVYSWYIMSAYQYSQSETVLPYLLQKSTEPQPFLHEAFVEALIGMEIDYYSKNTKPCTVPQEKLSFYYKKCFEFWGERIDALMMKEDFIPR